MVSDKVVVIELHQIIVLIADINCAQSAINIKGLLLFQIESKLISLLSRLQHTTQLLQTVHHPRGRKEAWKKIGIP